MKHFSENLVFFSGLLFMNVFAKNKCSVNFVHGRLIIDALVTMTCIDYSDALVTMIFIYYFDALVINDISLENQIRFSNF